jgi:hypothetical protein
VKRKQAITSSQNFLLFSPDLVTVERFPLEMAKKALYIIHKPYRHL